MRPAETSRVCHVLAPERSIARHRHRGLVRGQLQQHADRHASGGMMRPDAIR
jgi:hypothetical protein